jgi:hypothetical protein
VIDIADRRHFQAGCRFGDRKQALRTMRHGDRLVVYPIDALILKDVIAGAFGDLRGK